MGYTELYPDNSACNKIIESVHIVQFFGNPIIGCHFFW
jgi:hypothetical protein